VRYGKARAKIPAGAKGCDAGRKVSGIRRHVAVDTQGLPQAIAVTTAEATDCKGTLQALERCKPRLDRVKASSPETRGSDQ